MIFLFYFFFMCPVTGDNEFLGEFNLFSLNFNSNIFSWFQYIHRLTYFFKVFLRKNLIFFEIHTEY